MKPVDSQIKEHTGNAGEIGDCHRACIASLLELPIEDVPHFYDVDDGAYKNEHTKQAEEYQTRWLAERGLAFVELPFLGDTLEAVLKWVSFYSGETYYLLCAKSRGGHGHSVVCHKDKIVHDPTYGDPHGIVGPEGDHWWVGWLVKL